MTPPIRVLHTHNGLDPSEGGVVSAVVGMTRAQARAGLKVKLLCTFRAGEPVDLADKLIKDGIEVELIGPCHGRLHRSSKLGPRIYEASQEHDVLHTHAVWEDIIYLTAKSGQHLNKPYVISPHGMLARWSMQQSRWKKRAFLAWRVRRTINHAALLHFTAKNEARESMGLKFHAPTHIEPLGFDHKQFPSAESAAFADSLKDLEGRPFAMFLGRLHYKKGVDILLDAWRRTPDDMLLVIAGPDDDTDYTKMLREQAEKPDLRKRVFFTGMIDGTRRSAALAEARFLIVPSRQENFGLVVIEALAMNTPVLASEHVDIAHEVAGAGAGEVFPLEINTMAHTIKLWWNDKARRHRAVQAGQVLLDAQYNWDTIGQRWATTYAGLI